MIQSQVLSTLKILKVQGAVAIVSKIEIWPLSSLEIDNKIKIDQVIPSVLIAKKGRAGTRHLMLTSIVHLCQNSSKFKPLAI